MRTMFTAVLLVGILSVGMCLGVCGCSNAPAESKNANGSVQFPNTGRPPTQEEMNRITAAQQRQTGASTGSAKTP